ncbi:MAG TPA: site-2 protease family protein [Methanothrix sp.]|nr:site-2 protease family protein [Methanothrix sp.]
MALQLQLDSVDWLLIAVALIGLYSILLFPLKNSEEWRSRGVSVGSLLGIPLAIFFRTTRGLNLLDKLARPKTFWRLVASAGIPLVILSMTYFLMLVLIMTYYMIQEPPMPSSYNAPRNILLIPGLNEYIPFAWGWIALFVTMVVHEFAHGILSRVEGVRVKSMGIVAVLIAPIAAFVEPDEEELFGNKDKPPKVSRGARVRILSAGVISNFIVAAVAMALFFGPVIGSISPVDRLMVVDVQNGSAAQAEGFESSMVLLDVNGNRDLSLDQFYSDLGASSASMRVLYDDREQILSLSGEPARGIMVASIFQDSPAEVAGLPARSVISRIDGTEIVNLEGFRKHMNTTRPGQIIAITTGQGNTYQVNLTAKEAASEDSGGFIGIGISGNAVLLGGVIFQEAPARQFLQVLKALPSSGMQGFTYMLSLPFAGIPGFTQKGFPGFSGWLTAVFEPSGWAEPLGAKFFWIANLLLWIGWINLYAGLFNCLPAVPLDGGHIFRDLVQSGFERIVRPQEAERFTKTTVAILTWLVLTSLLITLIAPFTNWLPI